MDKVNPLHYRVHPSGIECIEIARHHNFNIGNAIKYLWREGLKDGESSLDDLRKAQWYIADEIKRVEKAEGNVDKAIESVEDAKTDMGEVCKQVWGETGQHRCGGHSPVCVCDCGAVFL